MKRCAALGLWIAIAAWSPAIAQEPEKKAPETAESHGEAADEKGEGEGMEMWKWANFAVLAIALGYMANKHGGPFFAARSQQIRKDMLEAAETRRQAEARAAEVDRRLANLDAEIANLRAESQKEAAAETERLTRHAADELGKVQAHTEREIADAGKAARKELQVYSAHLAITLAAQKVRGRMTPAVQDVLVDSFMRDLEKPASGASTT